MTAVQDDFRAAANATLERCYQITSGGSPQDITGWRLHSQWRYADGSLALDLTAANGLIVPVDAPSGRFKLLVQPDDLRTVTPGAVSYDIIAMPPCPAGTPPHVYCPFAGTVTITPGATL